jgi:uncharacterized membrane protein YraQ (UPF0718 family)
VAVGLRKRGASIGSTAALWLGNPTLNPAVLVFIIFTLGWPWAVLRLVLGAALVLTAAVVATRLTARATGHEEHARDAAAEEVASHTTSAPREEHWVLSWFRSLGRLAVRLTPEYIIMVAVLGAARAFFFPSAGFHLAGNPLVLVGLAILGTLFVIPTAGEVPIIQTMLAAGIGGAPAGVLLLTLAPVSLPSILMLGRVFPARVLAAIAGLTAAAGLVAALLAHALSL